MSLVEVLIAVLILGVAMTALAGSTLTAFASSRSAQDHVNSAQLINEVTENLLGRRWIVDDPATAAVEGIVPAGPTLVTTPAYGPFDRSGVRYGVTVEVTWVDHPCNGTGVAPAAGQADGRTDYLRMHVTTTWAFKGTPRSLDTVMFRTPTPVEKAPARSASC